MVLINRINNRIIELEKAEKEHREHNRIGYANQTKMIRWELQGLLQDECEGKTSEREKGNEILPLVSGCSPKIGEILCEIDNAISSVLRQDKGLRRQLRDKMNSIKKEYSLHTKNNC